MTLATPNERPGNHIDVAKAFARELTDLGIHAVPDLNKANGQIVNVYLCRETHDRKVQEMGLLSIYNKKNGQYSSMSPHLLKATNFERAIQLCWSGDHDGAQRAVDEIASTSSVPAVQAYVGGGSTEGKFKYFAAVLEDNRWIAEFTDQSDTCDLYAQMDGLRAAIEWCAKEGISELVAYVGHPEMRRYLNGSKCPKNAPAQRLVLAATKAGIAPVIQHLDNAPDQAVASLVAEVPAYA